MKKKIENSTIESLIAEVEKELNKNQENTLKNIEVYYNDKIIKFMEQLSFK